MAVAYREADAERTRDLAREVTRERIAWIAGEIGRFDALIGDWSTRVPDGTPAPPQAFALMVKKEELEAELRALAGALEPVASIGPSLFRTFLNWLTGRRAT